MILLTFMSIALANPAIQLEGAYQCFQPVESSWTKVEAYDGGYSVYVTDREYTFKGLDSEAFVLVDPLGRVEQAAFVYTADNSIKYTKLGKSLTRESKKAYGKRVEGSWQTGAKWDASFGNVIWVTPGQFPMSMVLNYVCK